MSNHRSASDLDVVTICKQKLHGGYGWWQAYRVGDDADGSWLFTPARSTFRSMEQGVEGRCEVEGGDSPGKDSLVLVPAESEHWMACWWVPERPLHINVEICGWVRRDPEVIAFEDWELDPFRLRTGVVAVEDVDDFVEARAAGLLDAERAEQSLQTAAWVERSLRQQTAPFDGRGDQLLAECGRLRLPPLTAAPHPLTL